MAATAIAAIGLGISAASAAGQAVYTSKAVASSRRAERLREQMMQAETRRRQRELIRQSILANAMTRARATGQGAGLESSAVAGAYGQTAGDVGRQGAALFENQVLGSGIFAANRQMADAQGIAATFNQAGQFGNALTANAQKITNIGSTVIGMFQPATIPNFTTTVSRANPTAQFGQYGPQYIPPFL